ALWQLRLGLLGDRCDSLTPGCPGRIVAVVGPGIAFPVVGCYNSHYSIPLHEGLNGRACDACLAAESHALAVSAYLLRSFYRLRFLPPRVRTLHPFGVLGIYAISSGCCVSCHQPLRDAIVTEHLYLMHNMIHYTYHNFNNIVNN